MSPLDPEMAGPAPHSVAFADGPVKNVGSDSEHVSPGVETEPRVLVIVDGSRRAEAALACAWRLARDQGGTFRVVFLIRDPWLMYTPVIALEDDPEQLVETEARVVVKAIVERFPADVSVEIETRRERVRAPLLGRTATTRCS